MKFAKKEQKNKVNRMLAALILLFLLLGFGAVGLLKTRDAIKLNPEDLINNLTNRMELKTPLPKNDFTSELTNLLVERNIPINFPLVATNSAILGNLIIGGEVWFSPNKSAVSQVDALQLVLINKEEGKKIKKIDLRFDHPSVIY